MKIKKLTSEQQNQETKNTTKSGTAQRREMRVTDESNVIENTKRLQENVSDDWTSLSLKGRLAYVTLNGGLNTIPVDFEDTNGSWTYVIHVDDPFGKLFFDYRLYKKLSPALIKKNYELLKKFWSEKIALMNMGANRLRIIQKYAPNGNENTLQLYLKQLEDAYQELKDSESIEQAYRKIISERQKKFQNLFREYILLTLTDRILEPSEEKNIIEYVKNNSDIEDSEIKSLIDFFLFETGSKREDSLGEAEHIFYDKIKDLLKVKGDIKILTIKDENELIEDSQIYGISSERYEQLIANAIKEIQDTEREKTFDIDKINFKKFFLNALIMNGYPIDHNTIKLEEFKYFQNNTSGVSFFPLSERTKKLLIDECVQEYSKQVKIETEKFLNETLKKFDYYENHLSAKNDLLNSSNYPYLLPQMREEQFKQAIEILIEKQATIFLTALKEYFKSRRWILDQNENQEIVSNPTQHSIVKNLRSDWLSLDLRVTLFKNASDWAKQQHTKETDSFKGYLRSQYKNYLYGLPVNIQKKIELDKTFILDQVEKRQIIQELEATLRQNAEKIFTNLIKSSIQMDTLIPEVEADLLKKGEIELLLTSDKNKHSFAVKTAKELLAINRKPFDSVVENVIKDLIQKRKVSDYLLKNYNIPHIAYTTDFEINGFVNLFKPANSIQIKTLLNIFKQKAELKNLYINSSNSSDDFYKLLYFNIEKYSKNYKLNLKKWLLNTFINDFVKIGEHYNFSKNKVNEYFDFIKLNYKNWTLPNINLFTKLFFISFFLTTIGRFIYFLLGYKNLLFTYIDKIINLSYNNIFFYIESKISILPFNPLVNWIIVCTILSFIIAFIFSTLGKKRSYLKLYLIILSFIIILFFIIIHLSNNEYNKYLNRNKILEKENINFKKIQCVCKKNLEIHTNYNANSQIIDIINKNTKFIYLFNDSYDKNWLKIKFNSFKNGLIIGFIDHNYIELELSFVIITFQRGAIIRSEATTSSTVVTTVAKGTKLKIISELSEWYQVQFEFSGNTKIGFIHKSTAKKII